MFSGPCVVFRQVPCAALKRKAAAGFNPAAAIQATETGRLLHFAHFWLWADHHCVFHHRVVMLFSTCGQNNCCNYKEAGLENRHFFPLRIYVIEIKGDCKIRGK
jgi:hypothetical protein